MERVRAEENHEEIKKEIHHYLVDRVLIDWSPFPFVEYFPSERFPNCEDVRMYYLDVVDVL